MKKSLKSAEEIRTEIYSKMSFIRKWEIACALRETAWKIKSAGVCAKHPNWNDQEVEAEVRRIFLYATT